MIKLLKSIAHKRLYIAVTLLVLAVPALFLWSIIDVHYASVSSKQALRGLQLNGNVVHVAESNDGCSSSKVPFGPVLNFCELREIKASLATSNYQPSTSNY